jgi:hypothetical protein
MSTTNKNLNNDPAVSGSVTGGVINESVETQALTVNGTSTLGLSTGVVVDSNGIIHIDNATDATGSTDGCLFTDGGVGIAKKLYVGTDLDIGGNATNTGLYNNIVIDNKNSGATQSIIIGDSSTGSNITSSDNSIAIGNGALATLVSANANIAIGNNALNLSTTGNSVAIGNSTLSSQTGAGQLNLAIGSSSGSSITTATRNISIGHNALSTVTTGGRNTCLGYTAGTTLTTDSTDNVIIGQVNSATYDNCDQSVFIGSDADGVAGTNNNQIAIGCGASSRGADSCTIGNSSLTVIEPGGDGVCDLGASDKQYKDIRLGGVIYVDGTQVLSSQAASIADASDAATVITQLNDLLAKLRTHGIIAT